MRKEKQFVGHLTILPHKFYNQRDIAVKSIFGVLELFATHWLMEDLLLNPKMSSKHTKKSKLAYLVFLILSMFRIALSKW